MKINNLIPLALLLTAACSSPSDEPTAAQTEAPASEQKQTASNTSANRPEETPSNTKEVASETPPQRERTVRFVPPVIVDRPEEPPVIDNNWDVSTKTSDYDGDWFVEPKEVPVMPETRSEDEIYKYVDEIAEFPGGAAAMRKFIEDNLLYPPAAKDLGIVGKCQLQFIVSAKGNISNVKVMRGVPDCPECDKEAIRVVKIMPQWKPGKIDGKEVNSVFNLPVSFKLSNQ